MSTKKKPTQLDRIESKLDTLLSGATFMQELDKNARQLQDMKEIGDKWDRLTKVFNK